MTLLLAFVVHSFEDGAVGPLFDPHPMLLVIFPLAIVDLAVDVGKFPPAVGCIELPLALINVTICVDESSNAMRPAVAPLPLVEAAVEPDKHAEASPRL